MKTEMTFKIELTPVFDQDERTKQWLVYYAEFPKAMASADTQGEAELRLISVLRVMIKERSQEIKEEIINNHLNDELRSKLGFLLATA